MLRLWCNDKRTSQLFNEIKNSFLRILFPVAQFDKLFRRNGAIAANGC